MGSKKLYKGMAKEIGRDVGRFACEGLGGVGKLAVKVAYPVLGNLSGNVQARLGERLGEEIYSSEDAFGVTKIVNPIVYTTLAGVFVAEKIYSLPIEFFGGGPLLTAGAEKVLAIILGTAIVSGIAGCLGYAENVFRNKQCECGEVPSLIGGVVSLPFDFAEYVSDKTYGYLGNVRKRVERKEELESRVGGGE